MSNQPTKFPQPTPLYALGRESIVEQIVYGHVFVLQDNEIIHGPSEFLDTDFVCRSIIKPWQFEAMQIGDPEHDVWSLCFASHSGQSIHQIKIDELIKQSQINPEDLLCPACFPFDPIENARMQSERLEPNAKWHECSGKHIGYLFSCIKNNFALESYRQANHPINQRLIQKIKDANTEFPKLSIDGCTNTAIAMTYKQFLNLAMESAKNPSKWMQICFELWKKNPRLVGGINRLDSDITEDLGGLYLAKSGADGLLYIQKTTHPHTTILVKLFSSSQKEHIILALWLALKEITSANNTKQVDDGLLQLQNYMSLKVKDALDENQQLYKL